MQPFDALTIRAVLQEAKPLLLNRRVDRVQQLGRDEIVLTLRSKAGMINLLMSAQTAYGRLCLSRVSSQPAPEPRNSRQTAGAPPTGFAALLRKHLTGATLVGIEQPLGERTVDFAFSCIDEVGGTALKVLTAEIMGRHSNLIFWDKSSEKIVCASHIVTREMSRQREVAPGLRFVRPPGQDKRNVFSVGQEEFADKFQQYKTLTAAGDITAPGFAATIEQWLINSFTGLGRHLAAELVAATASASASEQVLQDDELASKLWNKVKELQTLEQVRPAMKADLSTYTVLSWWPQMEANPDWKNFPAVNDLIDEYYRLAEAQEQFNQLRDRLRSELKGETEKLEGRIAAASAHLGSGDTSDLKRCGDLVLANIHNIGSGQEELVCENIFDSTEEEAAPSAPPLVIKLNPNMSAAQNAQAFYRQFAKSRARSGAATVARNDATQRLEYVRKHLITVETSTDAGELRQIKDLLIGRKPIDQTKQQPTQAKKKNKSRLLSTTSSDGWTIYVGRNRQENDYLLSKLARPFDFWMHVQGQGGAHVLIRVPASKQDPPMTTLKEGAHVAAKLSKAASGSKVRVVYTQCRYVKKLPGDKPGLVHYEKERTLEVDTATPMPQCMKQLFQQN